MSKDNKNFFKEKKSWSEVKDELLGCYLKPYLQKVIWTGRNITYVDCFAGKGRFDDGKPGSPIIALNIINDCLLHTRKNNVAINPYFIDLNHAETLRGNLSSFNVSRNNIISGKYEDNINKILAENQNTNVFLYIDPYGIKALNHKIFDNFILCNRFSSIELLINLNSFGFIRESCRVLGVKFEDESMLDDLIEYESTKLERNQVSVEILNEIAGGDYWKNIILKKNRGTIDLTQAEAEFSLEYCKRLKKYYKYVLNMPLRIKKGQKPKYRMVHATNHVDGCLIMVDNIYNRWEFMKSIQEGPQLTLFIEDCDNNIIDPILLYNNMNVHINQYVNYTRLNEILADYFVKYGPICKVSEARKVLKKITEENSLDVYREPQHSNTNKLTTFFSESYKQKVWLRTKNENNN